MKNRDDMQPLLQMPRVMMMSITGLLPTQSFRVTS